ncbi:MAG: hypothetical protein LBL66_08410 [Clostridiales bacterium]|nr:hypothetical protein [Clostridiales bacterium]
MTKCLQFTIDKLRIKDFAHNAGDFSASLEMTGQCTIHNAQFTIEGYGRGKRVGRALLARGRNQIGMTESARGVPLSGRDCRVALCAPRNRLVAKYGADAMRVFSCVKRVKIPRLSSRALISQQV